MSDFLEKAELAVEEILAAFDVDRLPIPVEVMLQRPREELWPYVDLSEMSASFLHLNHRYAPRMTVVRLLAKHIARSEWGFEHGLEVAYSFDDGINQLSRALIMPKRFIDDFPDLDDIPLVSVQFEVPEDDVVSRLQDLGYGVND